MLYVDDSTDSSSCVFLAGETISIYLGVKISTREINKKASNVFLSIYFTGSWPPFDKGWHLKIRISINFVEIKKLFLFKASSEYAEHEG